MKKKNFIYEMRLDFDAPIYGSDWHLMCVPASDDRQYITDLKVQIRPATRVYRNTDGFGNRVMYGHNEEPHTEFSVRVEGTAYTGIHAYETTGNFADTVVFRNPSALTKPGDELGRYLGQFSFHRCEKKKESAERNRQKCDESENAEKKTSSGNGRLFDESENARTKTSSGNGRLFDESENARTKTSPGNGQIIDGSDNSGAKLSWKDTRRSLDLKEEKSMNEKRELSNYDKAVAMMEQLHADMVYTPGATTIDTTAEEALALRRGVCQDYAHILIALCRMEKIPARYVVGMIKGEGATHAWVEVFSGGLWYGIDPTNLGFVVDDYVKISHGRDYRDCVVNKGKFYGGAKQRQTVSVVVT